ncbi:MAG: ABC transporter permease [Bacteroidota bacterium]
MLRNYLLIAFRNLWHNKVYALINILGLAIGLTAALFIFQYVQFEKSYDSFHENANHIYRVIMQINRPGNQEPPQQWALSSFAPIIKKECPEVADYARIYKHKTNDFTISYSAEDGTSPQDFLEESVFYADASFMRMFSFPLILGDSASLGEPNSILLSERLVQKLFGNDWNSAKPIGKILTINGESNFMIRGVFADIPENSHIKFEALLSLTTLANELQYDTEMRHPFPTYLQVDPQADTQQLTEKIMRLSEQYYGETMKGWGVEENIISLQPLRDTHLHSFGFKRESEVRGDATTVQFLLIAGCFTLILAWINYMNLSTARALKRAKEVGIRKVAGARRGQLIMQFLLEALLINLLSLVVALTLCQLLLPYFTGLVQKEVPITTLLKESSVLTGISLAIFLGTLLSGGYSAFVLSSFKAASTLKGKFHTSTQSILLRKGLIVFQFIISIGLIIGMFSIYQQLGFMKNYEKGYNQSQKLIVRAPQITRDQYGAHYQSFKNSVKEISEVGEVTSSFLSPGDSGGKGDQFIATIQQPEESHLFSMNVVDHDYLNTYEVQLLHGRGFSREFPADANATVITEDVALHFGFDPVESALQQKLIVSPGVLKREVTIIGIARNINLRSLQEERTGVLFLLQDDENQNYAGRYQANYFTIDLNHLSHLPENIAQVGELYKSHFPGNPFSYFFLDEYFNAQYRSEEQFAKVFTAASSLAIFIACLGLFGLSAFMVRQRTKEIGIRKVLGAPVQTILLLLSRDYLKLILLAGLIALPIAYFSLHRWLESYTVRISLVWWLFLAPLVIVVLIALIIVSVQTIKAALANPAKSLRYE